MDSLSSLVDGLREQTRAASQRESSEDVNDTLACLFPSTRRNSSESRLAATTTSTTNNGVPHFSQWSEEREAVAVDNPGKSCERQSKVCDKGPYPFTLSEHQFFSSWPKKGRTVCAKASCHSIRNFWRHAFFRNLKFFLRLLGKYLPQV